MASSKMDLPLADKKFKRKSLSKIDKIIDHFLKTFLPIRTNSAEYKNLKKMILN
jgi:hypothetical protein